MLHWSTARIAPRRVCHMPLSIAGEAVFLQSNHQEGDDDMARFVSKEKLSKKAQKELNRQRRVTWDFSPVTKTIDSRKIYSRKRKAQNRDDYGLSYFFA